MDPSKSLVGTCGLTDRQSYADIFATAELIPRLATINVIALGSLGL